MVMKNGQQSLERGACKRKGNKSELLSTSDDSVDELKVGSSLLSESWNSRPEDLKRQLYTVYGPPRHNMVYL